jgi:hypothetical protein
VNKTDTTILYGYFVPQGGTGLPAPTPEEIYKYRIWWLRSDSKRLIKQSGHYRVCVDDMGGHFALPFDSIHLP